MTDSEGNYWIVEYKGGGASLDAEQMSSTWVRKNIARLKNDATAAWSGWGNRLEAALKAGKLKGIAVRTANIGGGAGQTEELGRWTYGN